MSYVDEKDKDDKDDKERRNRMYSKFGLKYKNDSFYADEIKDLKVFDKIENINEIDSLTVLYEKLKLEKELLECNDKREKLLSKNLSYQEREGANFYKNIFFGFIAILILCLYLWKML